MSLNLTGSGGNATIDTTGGNISLAGNLTGSGTLNKIGPGRLSLSGTSSVLGVLNVDGGIVQILSGSLTVATEYVGYSGTGTLTQTGGTNTITNTLYLGYNPGSIGTYNLFDGLLVVSSIVQGSGSGTLNMTDGTLSGGTASLSISLPNSTLILAGPISGSGGLTKTGTSTLVLSGNNTYSGGTTISQGALLLANSNAAQNTTMGVGVNNGLLFSGGIGTFNVGSIGGSGGLKLADTGGNRHYPGQRRKQRQHDL